MIYIDYGLLFTRVEFIWRIVVVGVPDVTHNFEIMHKNLCIYCSMYVNACWNMWIGLCIGISMHVCMYVYTNYGK